jgi:hypothetical protein
MMLNLVNIDSSAPPTRPNMDPDAPEPGEEDEGMEAEGGDDAAMMAMMGMSGFGTTKVSFTYNCTFHKPSLCSYIPTTEQTCFRQPRRWG